MFVNTHAVLELLREYFIKETIHRRLGKISSAQGGFPHLQNRKYTRESWESISFTFLQCGELFGWLLRLHHYVLKSAYSLKGLL